MGIAVQILFRPYPSGFHSNRELMDADLFDPVKNEGG
jgi:hypothetical protein